MTLDPSPTASAHAALGTSPVRPDAAAAATGRAITCEIRTSATPEQAWSAWADPDKLAHWFVDRAFGDVRPGGVMTWVFEQFGYEIPYPVLEATAPERLVFGGEIPGYPPFRLEVTIAREGGETVVRLFNSGFRDGAQWDDEYQGVASGWKLSLALLRHYLEHHYGTPKRAILVMRPARFEFRDVVPFFTQEAGLARWLTRSGAVGAPGNPVRLELRNGEAVRGTVLDVTRQELALSWGDDMALELKAFAMGPTRMVGVRVTGWGVTEERMRDVEMEMNAAVGRLAEAIG
jgi:uncharacterized protein YndB with AHSA1/START domain